jgi:hypothetical protein
MFADLKRRFGFGWAVFLFVFCWEFWGSACLGVVILWFGCGGLGGEGGLLDVSFWWGGFFAESRDLFLVGRFAPYGKANTGSSLRGRMTGKDDAGATITTQYRDPSPSLRSRFRMTTS